VGNVNGWNYSLPSGTNPTITVSEADDVYIQLTSVDVQHRFYVDVDKNGIPDCIVKDLCSPPFNMTSPWTYGWVAGNLSHGNYTYYCSIHPSAMHGTFRVLSATPDFAISSSPSSLTIREGSFQTSTITVTSQGNFTGSISLSASYPSGVTATLNPSIVAVPRNGAASSTLNVTVSASTPSGPYSVTVTGSNTTVQRSTTVIVTVVGPDFTISPNTGSLSLVSGNSGTVTITVASVNSFSGNVNLTGSVSPNGPTVSLTSSTVNVGSGSSAKSILTVSTSSSNPLGNYTITVKGTANRSGGPLSHSTQVVLSVSSPSTGLSPLVIVAGVVGVLVVVSLVAVLSTRRKKTKA
jgi:hypothetical protein